MTAFRTSLHTIGDAVATAMLFALVILVGLGLAAIAGIAVLIAMAWPVILPVIGLLYILGFLA